MTDWAGTVGVGVSANNAEYFDEPAMAVMLCDLPGDQMRVFSGVAPGFEAHSAWCMPMATRLDLPELLHEMADRTETGYLFGGLAASRTRTLQFAISGDGNMRGQGSAGGVFSGGLSGVAFGPGVRLVSRVTQGCQPLSAAGASRRPKRNLVTALDGRPALDLLLEELDGLAGAPRAGAGRDPQDPGRPGAPPTPAACPAARAASGSDVLVRHIIGLDPARRGIAVSGDGRGRHGALVLPAQRAGGAPTWCASAPRSARSSSGGVGPVGLRRPDRRAAGAAALEPAARIAGAVYVSCSGRGGPALRRPQRRTADRARALGDVPLVGFSPAARSRATTSTATPAC